MHSELHYNKNGGWLYESPQANVVHDITTDDIDALLKCADEDDAWTTRVKGEVESRDQAIRNHKSASGIDVLIDEFRVTQVAGTVVTMPYRQQIITFPSRRHLFRGEIQTYEKSVPSLNRLIGDGMDLKQQELIRVIAHLRKRQFANLIWNINIVPYWEAHLSDVNYDALAQHYGLATHLMDLTNDFRAALFFATCKYVPETDSYRPLAQDDIDRSEDTRYGYIFHTPDWTIDLLNVDGAMDWKFKYWSNLQDAVDKKRELRYYLQSGDMDGVALQIGYQPLQRCDHQSGYIYPMRNMPSLQEDWHFEKLRFRQSVELSERVYHMMDNGKKVFPNEGIVRLRNYIEQIKHSTKFSIEELQAVYEDDGIDREIFPTIENLRSAIHGYDTVDGAITIQEEPVKYDIPHHLLDLVNSRYDDKDLLEAVGGTIHQKSTDRKYREQRCREIYGKVW